MKKILLGLIFSLWAGHAVAANNIVIQQANGQFAIISTSETGGVHTLNVSCPTCSGSSGLEVGVTTITSGTTTRVLYDNAGVLGEYPVTGSTNVMMSASPTTTGTLTAEAITMSGRLINSLNGAASAPPVSLTGTIFTGGSATTTKPALLIEPTGTTSTGWSTAGTLVGANAPSGFTGNLFDGQVAGVSKAYLGISGSAGFLQLSGDQFGTGPLISGDVGSLIWSLSREGGSSVQMQWATNAQHMSFGGSISLGTTHASRDMLLSRAAAASLQLGDADAASPVAQMFGVQSVVAGTSNTAGVNWTIRGSRSTGNAVAGDIIFTVAQPGTSGTTQNAAVEAFRIYAPTLTLRTSGSTVAALPTCAAAGAGSRRHITDQAAACVATGAALTGGGAVTCPVFCNGSAWVGG